VTGQPDDDDLVANPVSDYAVKYVPREAVDRLRSLIPGYQLARRAAACLATGNWDAADLVWREAIAKDLVGVTMIAACSEMSMLALHASKYKRDLAAEYFEKLIAAQLAMDGDEPPTT
jgi:hypothetical protein